MRIVIVPAYNNEKTHHLTPAATDIWHSFTLSVEVGWKSFVEPRRPTAVLNYADVTRVTGEDVMGSDSVLFASP